MPLIPPPFLFRFALPVQHVWPLPRRGSRLLDLPASCRLATPDALAETPPFAELRAAWNEGGIGFSAVIRGRSQPWNCAPDAPAESDGLRLWIDTRNTQSIHRAGRFCHHFCVLPVGGGPQRDRPVAVPVRIAHAREDARLADPASIPVRHTHGADEDLLEVWLPAKALTGFDPAAQPRLGFYYHLRAAGWGDQFLSVNEDFPFAHDPSMWSTLELAR